MKTRNGFVSNSSSSSYVILISDEAFEDVLSDAFEEEIHRDIIKHLVTNANALGIPSKILTYSSGNMDTWEGCSLEEIIGEDLAHQLQDWCEENNSDPMDEFYEALSSYGDKVSEHEKGFYHSEYM